MVDAEPPARTGGRGLPDSRLGDGYDVAIWPVAALGSPMTSPSNPPVTSIIDDLSKYEYFDPALKEAPPIKQRFYDNAAAIEKFVLSPDSRIMEIGSGSCQLLKAVRDRRFDHILGSDPSPGCVGAAERLYGIPRIAGSIFTLPQLENSLDFPILIGVMEHIRDLAEAVKRLHALLRDDGRVYIEVPDVSRYAPDADAPFQEFSVEHINLFSGTSLANLTQRRGFQAIAIERTVRRRTEIESANVVSTK